MILEKLEEKEYLSVDPRLLCGRLVAKNNHLGPRAFQGMTSLREFTIDNFRGTVDDKVTHGLEMLLSLTLNYFNDRDNSFGKILSHLQGLDRVEINDSKFTSQITDTSGKNTSITSFRSAIFSRNPMLREISFNNCDIETLPVLITHRRVRSKRDLAGMKPGEVMASEFTKTVVNESEPPIININPNPKGPVIEGENPN
jgi:hypothetical protein